MADETKAKLLLIEDDITLIKMYERKFKSDGFDVIIAYDGLEGLDKAAKEKPDLVLLDIMLPKLDGLAVFKKLRSQPSTFNTPVILLTNFGQEDAVFECFKLGAVDYLVKADVTPQQVVSKVENFLSEQKK
ncbi:MAG: alkaline phosphatase synthesis transcriptional regulatory protein [Berkelbacteria bacterium GW2011_GWB1_38_5]|uniref:Alkaline phosphatase synthesis transcriptional regulatory protein n=2 Tax=Candidatus Berkelbacteria TaxID=1618330 RepID=A0A0G0LRJ0_9BACT|nr:MAG: alkaline phosphatase synthesis transcriptional regulatory protein [Berkelbacteria bacterium GW2011_GWB1_38_5]KKQ90585.1 MAG: alkaline phosphatase synthesis transcriptional regulatory protein [Berkelbacteria bacterium GW2011_GWA1_39_10]